MDDDLIYWHGVAVGTVERGHIVFFASAPAEAVAALAAPERAAG